MQGRRSYLGGSVMPTPCARGHKRAATQTAADQMVGNGAGAERSVGYQASVLRLQPSVSQLKTED